MRRRDQWIEWMRAVERESDAAAYAIELLDERLQPPPLGFTRPEPVHFRYGWRLRLPRLQATGHPVTCSVDFMVDEQLPCFVPHNEIDLSGFA